MALSFFVQLFCSPQSTKGRVVTISFDMLPSIDSNDPPMAKLYALKEFEIASVGTRPDTRYGIMLDKAKIEIVY